MVQKFDMTIPPPAEFLPGESEEISRAFRVDAVPSRRHSGFLGSYCIPGKDRQFATTEDGQFAFFATEDAAMAAAATALCNALNNRVFKTGRIYDYERLRPADFSMALTHLGLSPFDFARMHGNRHDRVMKWIDGKEDIPPWVRPVLAAYGFPEALYAAQEEADRATKVRDKQLAYRERTARRYGDGS